MFSKFRILWRFSMFKHKVKRDEGRERKEIGYFQILVRHLAL